MYLLSDLTPCISDLIALQVRAYTSDQQMDVLVEAKALIATDQYRVLIIDSAMALFRVDYTGRRGELADLQQKLNKYLPALL